MQLFYEIVYHWNNTLSTGYERADALNHLYGLIYEAFVITNISILI